jgi:hypothetical protein
MNSPVYIEEIISEHVYANLRWDRYATYAVAGIGIILGCGIYYVFWIYILPKIHGYHIRQEAIKLENDEQTHKLVHVPNAEIERWDATHDAVGRETLSVDPGDGIE